MTTSLVRLGEADLDENKATRGNDLGWSESSARKLQATHCSHCGRTFFPAKEVCSSCYTAKSIASVELSPFGRVYAFTIQRMMTPKWGSQPLVVCYADLQLEGIRVFGRLECAPEEAQIGLPVELVVDDREVAPDGFVYYHFRPVVQASKES